MPTSHFKIRHGIALNSSNPSVSVEFNVTDAMKVPTGNNDQRSNGASGHLRYNSETNTFEGYSNGQWITFIDGVSITSAISGKANLEHGHVISDVTNLQTSLNAKLDSSSYTAADVRSKLLTVDGNGSGVDADLWKGATFTVSTSAPSGGTNGDFWFRRES